MANANVKGPGVFWVTSSISKTGPLAEPTFLKWYDEDHIPEILATSGIDNAFRTLHVDKTSPYGTAECPKPFLAFYPMQDLAFTQGDEFKKIKVKSDLLPGTSLIYDLADFDVGYYGLVGKSGEGKSEGVKVFITLAIEPKGGEKDEKVNELFDKQIATVSKTGHYVHSRIFRLQYARTNAQSRAIKGLLPVEGQPAVPPEPPTWLVVHSFSAEPKVDVRKTIRDVTHEVFKNAKQKYINAYNLDRAQGKGKFFDDE